MDLFRFIPGYSHAIYQEGKEPLFLLILAFLVTFALTRGYTRIARVRGWGSAHVGGVHMHHVVPGVLILLTVGIIDFALAPGEAVRCGLAIAFGAGAALMLDEFAMVVHIEDVYWSPEGRSSVDAVVFVAVASILLLVSSTSIDDSGSRSTVVASVLVTAAFCLVALLKGKLKIAVLGVIILGLGIIGAVRLAKPDSWWARRFYDPGRGRRAARKHARALKRARVRERRWEHRRLRLYDVLGGAPSTEAAAVSAERVVADRERDDR
jgi:hypothetical protein